MAQLAIKGHATRGKEVIEILEMLGGSNPHNYSADCESLCFHIGENTNSIYYDWVRDCYEDGNTLVFTLEEFLEKYPYKVGDRVQSKGSTHNHEIYIIKSMEWDDFIGQIYYTIKKTDGIVNQFKWTAQELMFYQSQKEMEEEGTLVQIDLTRKLCVADEVEVILGDYEFVLKDGKTYFVKKKTQYPKNYKECCDVLKIPNDERYIDIDVPLDYNKLLSAFTELIICRNAYWKIAGEQMGLGKPWEPDWLNVEQDKFVLYTHDDVICLNRFVLGHNVLAFPTAEMRDAFLENFKNLIESCKELL